MMDLLLNKNQHIVGYASVGGVVGGITVDPEIMPEDFAEDFWSEKWAYRDGVFVRTDVPKPDTKPEPLPEGPGTIEELTARVAELSAAVHALVGLEPGEEA